MTIEEYQNLRKFKPAEHLFREVKTFMTGDIFQVYTMYNTVVYLKVTDSWEGLFYDLKECTYKGESTRFPLTVNSIVNSEILSKITNNDWCLLKRAETHLLQTKTKPRSIRNKVEIGLQVAA